MLTHRSRSWSTIKESMRRERIIQDLLHRSGTTRLHQRVTVKDQDRATWRRAERLIVETEKGIKALDPNSVLFWTQYHKRGKDLLRLYQDAKVNFDL